MKKFLTVIASMAVIGSMTCTAFAAGEDKNGGPAKGDYTFTGVTSTETIDVKAVIKKSDVVYSVKVEWDSMEFTYTTGKWDPSTHLYTTDGAGWDSNNHDIVVTNHSNAEVAVSAAVAADTADDGITLSVTGDAKTLKDASTTGIYGVPASADKVTFTVSAEVSDLTKLPPTSETAYDIGDIKVTIAAPAATTST